MSEPRAQNCDMTASAQSLAEAVERNAIVCARTATTSARGAAGIGRAKLAWVIVESQDFPVHVSLFKDLAPRLRPSARCPVCREAVTMRLGSKKVHHAAHQPKSRCWVQQAEGALHLNVKLHIAAELRAAQRILIQERCVART